MLETTVNTSTCLLCFLYFPIYNYVQNQKQIDSIYLFTKGHASPVLRSALPPVLEASSVRSVQRAPGGAKRRARAECICR